MSIIPSTFKIVCGVIFLIVCLDQLAKLWVYHSIPSVFSAAYLYPYGGIGMFQDVFGIEFSLNHVTNKGAAWGIGGDHQIALVVIRIFLILGLSYYLLTHRNWRLIGQISLAMIIAGAGSNVLDFFLYGHVIDMFHVVLWGYDFPTFNIADSAISIGIGLMFLFNCTTPSKDAFST